MNKTLREYIWQNVYTYNHKTVGLKHAKHKMIVSRTLIMSKYKIIITKRSFAKLWESMRWH